MAVPQLKLYKDESLSQLHLERLNELWNLFKDDNPKWLSRQECMNLKNAENMIVVFSTFEGSAFEHLRKLNARILSVHCMLYSLKSQKKLPRSAIPVFSFSMINLNVCCTNMEKKLREDICDKVEMMRGKISKIFTEQVTHLITTEVGSAKYHAAGGMKIPVMLPEWVQEIWKISEDEDIHGTDARFLKYKCPIFHKYVICASGFSEIAKNEIKSLVENEGAAYKGDLVCGTTTHLVTNEPKGPKYEHAKVWKITIVKPQWIYDSIKAGYCLPEKNFALETDNQTSTPTDSRITKKKIPDIDVSVIGGTNKNITKCINETENGRTFMGNNSFNTSLNSSSVSQINKNIPKPAALLPPPQPANNYADILKDLNSIGKIKLTLFDGIGNFDMPINEKLKKICNSGGAIRFDEYCSDVTHVIVNIVDEKKCKSYIELNPEVNILKIEWLTLSCKENQLADCKNFCVFKNALNSVKTPKKRARPEKLNTPTANISTKAYDSDLNDCLSQYLCVESEIMKPPNNPAAPFQQPQPPTEKTLIKMKQFDSIASDSGSSGNSIGKTLINKPMNSIVGVFSNKKISIFGFEESETDSLENLLTQKGATVVSYDEESFSCDYSIFPMTTPGTISTPNPATVYWMRKCIELNKLVDLNEDIFYQPIPRFNQDKPLSDCVITISGYGNQEKDNIGNLSKLLGAQIQNSLSMKHAPGIQPNTHLICKQTTGPKYTAAKSWKLPIVCPEWLVESCVTGIKADEAKYELTDNKKTFSDLIDALNRMKKNDDNTQSCYSGSSNLNKPSSSNKTSSETSFAQFLNNSKHLDNQDNFGDEQNQSNQNDLSLSFHNESKKPRLDTSNSMLKNGNLIGNDEDDGENEDRNNDDNDLLLAAMENSAKGRNLNRTANNLNPQITPKANLNVLCNPRLKEIKKHESFYSPQPQSPNETNKNNLVKTPLWMKPDDYKGEFRLNLDVESALECLKTPDVASNLNQLKSKKNLGQDTPLDELFSNAIQIRCEKAKNGALNPSGIFSPEVQYSFETNESLKRKLGLKDAMNYFNEKDCSPDDRANNMNNINNKMDEQSNYDRMAPASCTQSVKKILKEVKVYVCKNLLKDQVDLYKIVESLGGDFSWTYSEDCTHFIYNGKLSDNNKELKVAKEEGKIIVRPSWLFDCQQQNKHIDEHQHLISNRTSIIRSNTIESASRMNSVESENNYNTCNEINDVDENDTRMDEIKEDERMEEQAKNYENEMNFLERLEKNGDNLKPKEDSKMPEIPDSMAIKHNFLEQLSDKLANLKNNTLNNNNNKKWGKNNSGGNGMQSGVSNTTNLACENNDQLSDTDFLNSMDMCNLKKFENNLEMNKNENINGQDETVLTEQQALNELNKSKSKWGYSGLEKKKSKSIDQIKTNDVENKLDSMKGDENNENDDDNDDEISLYNKRSNKYITRKGKGSRGDADNDKLSKNMDDISSPSITSKENKGKKSNFNNENMSAPASSQIQVTLWKEEYQVSSAPSRSSSTRAVKSNNKQVVDDQAITDRILTAARAANSKK